MEPVIKIYEGYKLTFMLQPGNWMNDEDLSSLKRDLDGVNQEGGLNLAYGVFVPGISLADVRIFCAKANICVIRDEKGLVGFFYHVILQEKPFCVIHGGLLVINRNKGVDLLLGPYHHMALLQWKKYKNYYFTNISNNPAAIGHFSNGFSHVWPSHKSNLIRPPSKDYVVVLNLLYRHYIQQYFPNEGMKLDPKRFVLTYQLKDMGFEGDMRKLSRYPEIESNVFCMFWIDYSKGEDLVQVGVVDLKCIISIGISFALRSIIGKLKALKKMISFPKSDQS
jgi:hypothetical protein